MNNDELAELIEQLDDMAAGLPLIQHTFNELSFTAARMLEKMRDETARLRTENTALRLLVQRNPDWKCTYGHQIDSMAKCPQGFPGCDCADDLMAGEDEAFRSTLSEIKRLHAALQKVADHHEKECDGWKMYGSPADKGWITYHTNRQLLALKALGDAK